MEIKKLSEQKSDIPPRPQDYIRRKDDVTVEGLWVRNHDKKAWELVEHRHLTPLDMFPEPVLIKRIFNDLTVKTYNKPYFE